MTEETRSADRLRRAAEIAAAPEALFWAGECGWVPGTGHCRNRGCDRRCTFSDQREAEAHCIVRDRRRRRASCMPFGMRRPRR